MRGPFYLVDSRKFAGPPGVNILDTWIDAIERAWLTPAPLDTNEVRE